MRAVAAFLLALFLPACLPARAEDHVRSASPSDLESGYARLLALWKELDVRNQECARVRPTPSAALGDQIDEVAQILGTKAAKDPMIRCWGRWSVDWNQRLTALRDECRDRSPSPRRRAVEEMSSLLGDATWDLHLLWREYNRRAEGGAPDPSGPLERLRADLDPVRKFLRDQGKKAEDFEGLVPKP